MAAYNTQAGATLAVFRAKVAITRGCIVRVDTVDEEVDLPGATNDAGCVGFATHDAAIGEPLTVHLSGGVACAVAGGSIAIGDYIGPTGTAGAVVKVTLGASNQYVYGKAIRAAASGDLFPVIPLNFIAQGA